MVFHKFGFKKILPTLLRDFRLIPKIFFTSKKYKNHTTPTLPCSYLLHRITIPSKIVNRTFKQPIPKKTAYQLSSKNNKRTQKASNVSNCCVPDQREGTCSHNAPILHDLNEVEQSNPSKINVQVFTQNPCTFEK